jgi:predicted lysophospholipase L1 biosynthesis ABC-type transport system permease subunit
VGVLLGLGTWAVGLGSLTLFVLGCGLLGLGMAGWMLPLGVIREHTDNRALAWRTGLYRVGVDGAVFLGPVLCGLLGEAQTGAFVLVVGLAALAVAGRLGWLVLR